MIRIEALALIGAALALAGCSGRDASSGAAPTAQGAVEAEAVSLDLWLERLEVGSRELYNAREAVAAALELKPGARVADIGAGTGLYTLLFAQAVGAAGEVYAVDIEPRFLKLINQRAEEFNFDNVVAVLGRQDSITLPPASVDAVFICDTYHYFEDPAAIMQTVRDALRPGGAVFIVDYEVADGADPPADKRHVRFGKRGVAAEVETFGFAAAEEITVSGLSENYMLRFAKA
jgi:ubiquinone/menaquinone biosynthesis C-methylase UbiE